MWCSHEMNPKLILHLSNNYLEWKWRCILVSPCNFEESKQCATGKWMSRPFSESITTLSCTIYLAMCDFQFFVLFSVSSSSILTWKSLMSSISCGGTESIYIWNPSLLQCTCMGWFINQNSLPGCQLLSLWTSNLGQLKLPFWPKNIHL